MPDPKVRTLSAPGHGIAKRAVQGAATNDALLVAAMREVMERAPLTPNACLRQGAGAGKDCPGRRRPRTRASMNKQRTRIQERNSAAILEAALWVFSQHGFRGATLDQIAEKSGLSKPNLLYYFPSKEAVHRALLEGLLKAWLDPLRALDPGGEPVQEIRSYVRRKLKLSRDFPRESRLFANEILQGAPRIMEAI